MAPPVGRDGAIAPGYLTGLVFNLSNPKAYAAFAALFAGFELVPDAPPISAVTEAAVCYVIVVVADIAWLLVGSVLRRHLHDPRKSRAINISFAVLLVLSVLPALAVLR